jgi:hypothetical protein
VLHLPHVVAKRLGLKESFRDIRATLQLVQHQGVLRPSGGVRSRHLCQNTVNNVLGQPSDSSTVAACLGRHVFFLVLHDQICKQSFEFRRQNRHGRLGCIVRIGIGPDLIHVVKKVRADEGRVGVVGVIVFARPQFVLDCGEIHRS